MNDPILQDLSKRVVEVYGMLEAEFVIWSTSKNDTVEKIGKVMRHLAMIRSCDNPALFVFMICKLPSDESVWRACFRKKGGTTENIDTKRERTCQLVKSIIKDGEAFLETKVAPKSTKS